MRSECYTTQGGAAEAGRSGSGVQVWGWLSVWIPQIGVRESRDITLYEGTASVLPDDGSTAEVQDVDLPTRRRPTPHLRRTTQRVSGTATMRGQRRRRGETCTSCTHPHAVKPVPSLTENLADDIPASLAGIRATNSLRTWGNFILFHRILLDPALCAALKGGVHSLPSENLRGPIQCSGLRRRPLILRQFKTRATQPQMASNHEH